MRVFFPAAQDSIGRPLGHLVSAERHQIHIHIGIEIRFQFQFHWTPFSSDCMWTLGYFLFSISCLFSLFFFHLVTKMNQVSQLLHTTFIIVDNLMFLTQNPFGSVERINSQQLIQNEYNALLPFLFSFYSSSFSTFSCFVSFSLAFFRCVNVNVLCDPRAK